MQSTLPQRRLSFAVAGPPLLALLYMLPRILDAHFGLLDDAVTLIHARNILSDPAGSLYLYAGAGRFLPCYWLYWAFWYLLGGENPAVYYIGNALLLAATVAALGALMRKWDAGPFETWTASLFFLFSAPVAEGYFTLSKGEPVTLLAFLCALLLADRAGRSTRPALCWTLAAALVLLAFGTRETSIASLGVVAVWYALSFWRGFGKPVFPTRRAMAVYIAMLAAGAAPILIGRFLLRRTLVAGSYASGYQFTWANIHSNIVMWSYYLVRDYPALCLFAAIAAFLAWRRKLARPQPLLMMAAWMACCMAIYLPWRYLSNYYLLPFSAAAAVFCGFMTAELRPIPYALFPIPFLLVAVINSVNAARCQVMVDQANAELVEALRRLPPDSTVLMNVPFDHEYVFELKLHLNERLGRKDLRFQPLDFTAPGAGPHYVVSMQSLHERWPLLRGPMLEAGLNHWNRSWQGAFGEPAARRAIGHSWQMADIGLQAAWCAAGVRLQFQSFAPMCQMSPRPAIDLRRTFYGWTIDPYPRWKEPVQIASFDDGVWTIGDRKLALGQPGDLPVAADWTGGGRLEPGVYRPSANRWIAGPGFTLPDMQPGDLPIAADWTGTRKAAPGFYRPADNTWHIASLPVVHLGGPGAVPLAGDWDADGRATPGVYFPANGVVNLIDAFREDAPRVVYTLSARSTPVVVNWTGVGVDTVNTVKDGRWTRRFANCECLVSNPLPEFSSPPTQARIFAWR